MAKFEPFFYYVFVFFGLLLALGAMIFIAYHATNKSKKKYKN